MKLITHFRRMASKHQRAMITAKGAMFQAHVEIASGYYRAIKVLEKELKRNQ